MKSGMRAMGACVSGLILSLGASAWAEEPAQPKNLVPNGDFEAAPAGEETKGKLPPEWTVVFASVAPLQVVAEARPGSTGKQCFKINTDEKIKTAGMQSPLIPFDGKKPLTVSGWVKGGGMLNVPQGAYFGVGWYDADKKPASVRKGTPMNYTYVDSGYKADQWIRRTLTCVPAPQKKETYNYNEIPPEAAFFDIRLFTLGYPKPAWFDDITATQPAEAKKAE